MKKPPAAKAIALAAGVLLIVGCSAVSAVPPTPHKVYNGPWSAVVAPMPAFTPSAAPESSYGPTARPARSNPEPTAVVQPKVSPAPRATTIAGPTKVSLAGQAAWHFDPNVSFYGPGFYGHRTACGLTLTTTLIGVANRTLPCGTLIRFRYNGITITAPVVDRGPYGSGRQWDLTGGLCLALRHCFTGAIEWSVK